MSIKQLWYLELVSGSVDHGSSVVYYVYINIYIYIDTYCPRFPSNIGKCLNTFGIYGPCELVFSTCMNPELVLRHRMKLEIGKYPFRNRVLCGKLPRRILQGHYFLINALLSKAQALRRLHGRLPFK